jgi:hypothetical protein
MSRTDAHRPAAATFNPEDYDYTGAVFNWHPEWPQENDHANEIKATLVAQGYRFGGVHGSGRCDHCGAHLRYAGLLIHRPSRTLIYAGEQCMDNRFSGSAADFRAMRAGVKAAQERKAKLEAFNALCDKYPVLAFATYAENIQGDGLDYHRAKLADLLSGPRQYGDITPGRLRFITSLVDEMAAKVAQAAEWAAARAARVNAHQGAVGAKLTVSGVVRMAREMDNPYDYYGGVRTLLVVDTPGGTVKWMASKALPVDRGDAITLTGKVKAHDDYQGEAQTVLTHCKIS